MPEHILLLGGFFDSAASYVKVFRLTFNSGKSFAHFYRSHPCCPASYEWITNGFVIWRMSYAPLHQSNWLLRRMFFGIASNADAAQLGWLLEAAPSLFTYRKAKILWLHFVPNQKSLTRRQRKVITTPHNQVFHLFLHQAKQPIARCVRIPIHALVSLSYWIIRYSNPIRRVSQNQVAVRQSWYYLATIAKVKRGISYCFNSQNNLKMYNPSPDRSASTVLPIHHFRSRARLALRYAASCNSHG